MVSLNTALNYSLLPPARIRVLRSPAISVPPRVYLGPRRTKKPPPAVNPGCCYCGEGVSELRSTVCRGWESEGDLALESEILEFMTKSEKPGAFPTKKELLDAGRVDLVKAISEKGGWLSLGWDSDDEIADQSSERMEITDKKQPKTDGSRTDARHSQERVESGNSVQTGVVSSHSASSLQMEDEHETGIEGILSGLEKQRNLSLGINLEKNLHPAPALRKQQRDDADDADSEYLGRSNPLALGSRNKVAFSDSGIDFSQRRSVSDINDSGSLKPEMLRAWSLQRAGFLTEEVGATEISYHDKKIHEGRDSQISDLFEMTEISNEVLGKENDSSKEEVRRRLQYLEHELAFALCSLRSKNEKYVADEAHPTSDELQNLSDASEFQENDSMHAREKLRSIRAKLAVLEGKMELAITDAQKAVEKKRTRVDSARRALELLRSVCIVWPNSASEVLVAGSFDGWTTQRKMERSSSGIFSLYLKLYPGRYEIKFIVDGIWRVDPLRPVVDNDGYHNNLLIIS